MGQQRIHQAHATQLVHQRQVALRGLQRPGEGAGVTRPHAGLLPAQARPQLIPAAGEAAQQAQLHRKAEATLGIDHPEAIEALQIRSSDRGHLGVVDVAALDGIGAGQLAQVLTGEPVGLLEGLVDQRPLQGGVIEALSAAHRQPALRMALPEAVDEGIPLAEQQLHQGARGPVVSGGVEAVELLGNQGAQLQATLLQLRNQRAPLPRRGTEKTLQQLVGTDRGGDRGSGKHREGLSCRQRWPTMSGVAGGRRSDHAGA